MKKMLIASLLLMPISALAELYNYKVLRVIDGDTVEVEALFLPKPLAPKLAVRVFGVDTPEKGSKAKCGEEKTMGSTATAYTKKFIADGKKVQVEIKNWDKFGGRVLGDIIVDGKSLRASLIQNGYAREYFGDKKQTWCQI